MVIPYYPNLWPLFTRAIYQKMFIANTTILFQSRWPVLSMIFMEEGPKLKFQNYKHSLKDPVYHLPQSARF